AQLRLLLHLLVGGGGDAEAFAGRADGRVLDLLRTRVAEALGALRADVLGADLRMVLAAAPGDGERARALDLALSSGGGGRSGGRGLGNGAGDGRGSGRAGGARRQWGRLHGGGATGAGGGKGRG